MKTLLSLIGVALALWMFLAFVLPQTRFPELARQEIEAELSRLLARQVEIVGDLKLEFLPPRLTAQRVKITYQQKNWLVIEKAAAAINLASFLSRGAGWMTLSLTQPVFSFRSYGFSHAAAAAQPLQPLLSFAFITIHNGRVIYRNDKINAIVKLDQLNGFIRSDGRRGPFAFNLRFAHEGRRYQSDFSLARLGKVKAIAADLTIKRDDATLALNGAFNQHYQFQGDAKFESKRAQGAAKLHMRGDQIDIERLTFQAHARAIKLNALKAKGSIDLALLPTLRLTIADGVIIWQNKRFTKIAAAVSADMNHIDISRFRAALPDGSGGEISGAASWQAGEINSDFYLRAPDLEGVAKLLGLELSPRQLSALIRADLAITLRAKEQQLALLKINGQIDQTRLTFEGDFSNPVSDLQSIWQSSDAISLARQLGLADGLASPGRARARWRLKGDLAKQNRFAALIHLGDRRYVLTGSLAQKNAAWQRFDGLVKVEGRSAGKFLEHVGLAAMIDTAPEFQFAAALKAEPNLIHFERLRLENERRVIKGELSLNAHQNGWRIQADLNSAREPWVLLKTRMPAAQKWSARPLWRQRWPHILKQLSGQITLRAENINIASLNFAQAKIDIALPPQKNALRVKNFSAKIGGGNVHAALDLSFSAQQPNLNIAFAFNEIDLAWFARNFSRRQFLQGRLTLNAQLGAEGRAPAELIQSLFGSGSFSIAQGQFVGFDASLLDQALPQLDAFSFLPVVINYAFNNGTTQFDNLSGKFRVDHGRLRAKPIILKHKNLLAHLALGADLKRQHINARFDFKLPVKPKYPPLQWNIFGSWQQPRQTFNLLGLEKAFAQDIISGGLRDIKNNGTLQQLPLALQDLLQTIVPRREGNELIGEIEFPS